MRFSREFPKQTGPNLLMGKKIAKPVIYHNAIADEKIPRKYKYQPVGSDPWCPAFIHITQIVYACCLLKEIIHLL